MISSIDIPPAICKCYSPHTSLTTTDNDSLCRPHKCKQERERLLARADALFACLMRTSILAHALIQTHSHTNRKPSLTCGDGESGIGSLNSCGASVISETPSCSHAECKQQTVSAGGIIYHQLVERLLRVCCWPIIIFGK